MVIPGLCNYVGLLLTLYVPVTVLVLTFLLYFLFCIVYYVFVFYFPLVFFFYFTRLSCIFLSILNEMK